MSTVAAGLMVLGVQQVAADAVEPEPGVPWIQSDKADYPPGALVHLDGGNWQSGELVHVYVNDDQGRTWERSSDVVADQSGAIIDDFNLPDWFVATYQVTATGELSGTAVTTFTDSNVIIEIAPAGTVATITRTIYNAANCSGSGTTTQGTTDIALAGGQSLRLEASATADANRVFQAWSSTNSATFTIITGTNGRAICVTGANNNGALKYLATYQAPAAAATTTSITSGVNPSAYGAAVTFTATVTSSPTNPSSGSVTFKDGATVLCNAVALNGNQATCTTPGQASGTLSVGSHSVTATYNPSAGYLTSASTALTQQVTKRTLTGSFTADNKEYDGTDAATIAARDLSGGIVAGEVVSLAGGTATFDNKNVGLGKTVTGTGFSLTGAHAGNYQLASTTLTTTADIAAHGVTVGFTAQDKTYDGTTAATISSRNLTGVASDDTVTISGGTAVFANKNAGEAKPVTASGFVLGGTDAANYTVTSVTPTTASIAPKSITGSFTADDKTYDRTTTASVASRSLTGMVMGDDVSLSGGTADFATSSAGNNKTVTLTGATLSGADKDNYTLSGIETTTATINPKTVSGSFTADDKTYDGDDSATITDRVVHGVLTGDTVALSGGSATFADKNVGVDKVVTLTGATLTGADKDNYSLGTVATTTATIHAQSLTGRFTASDKTYDGDDSATVTDRSLVGVVDGDVVTLTGGTATFADRHVGIDKTVMLSGALLAGADKDNYTLASVDTALADITAKEVSGSFTAADKPYDGNVDATIVGRALTGGVGDDAVQLVGGTATFGSRTVGVDKTVTGTGFSLGGADAGDYVLQSTTLTTSASITARGIDGHFTADNKNYDGTRAASVSSRTLSGVLSGDDVTLVGGDATFDTKDAGADKSVTLTGAHVVGEDADNYAFSNATLTTTATVFRRDLLIKADDKTKVYGADNPAFTGSISGIQNNEAITLSLTTPATAASGVGAYAIVPHADAAAGVLDNYTVIPTDGTLTVTKAPLTLKADPKSKVYGDDVPALTISVEGLVNGDTVGTALTGNPTLGTTALASSPVATYPITLTGGTSANYELTRQGSTLDVTKAPLTLRADPKSKVYGADVPALTFSIEGLVNGDTVGTALTGDPTLATTAVKGSNVGSYPVTLSGGTSANYELTRQGSTLDVTKAPLTLRANPTSKVYGADVPALTFSVEGLVNGDTVGTALTAEPTLGTTALASSPVATYSITLSGGTSANYELTRQGSALDVTKAPLTLRADPKSKVYGADVPALTFSVEGLVNGDTVGTALTTGPTLATTAVETSGVGPYPITVTGGTSDNYELTRQDSTLTVTKAPLTLKADPKSKILGADNPVLTFSVEGLVNGDTVGTALTTGPTLATTAVKTSDVGPYPITLTGGTSDNYELTRQDSTLRVLYAWDGFLQPINDTAHQVGVYESKFKLGQTIPVKFDLKDAAGNVVTQTGSPTFTRSDYLGACDQNATLDTVPTVSADGAAVYTLSGGHYQYNWSTMSVSKAGEYRIFAHLADGTSQSVYICLTK